MTSSIRAGYDTRTYTLTAGVQQSLPSAREFLIISASVDITAIGFNLGDNNGDFEVWPYGFAIGVTEGSVKARIQSSVTQTVVIAMIDGIATVKDNRFAPGAGTLPVTMADGASVALGARADASATTDGGTFSLISLFKRMLGKMGPVTSVDGGLVSIGATTDAAATSDAGTFSLIALIKRLLGKSSGGPDTYGARFDISTLAGSASANTVVVPSGTNVNGILLSSCVVAAGDDPTALAVVFDSVSAFMRVQDGRAVSLGAAIILPAGQQLAVNTTGKCYISMTYRVL